MNPHKFNLLLRDKKVIRRIFVREAFKYVQWKVSGDKNDNKLTFEEHVEGLCKKASQKVIGKISKSYFKELLSKDSALTKYFNQMPKPKKKSFCILKDLIDRSSHRKCFARKGALRNFAKLRGKHLVLDSLFLINLQASVCNFIKKETLALLFSCEFCEISKNTFFKEHL